MRKAKDSLEGNHTLDGVGSSEELSLSFGAITLWDKPVSSDKEASTKLEGAVFGCHIHTLKPVCVCGKLFTITPKWRFLYSRILHRQILIILLHAILK